MKNFSYSKKQLIKNIVLIILYILFASLYLAIAFAITGQTETRMIAINLLISFPFFMVINHVGDVLANRVERDIKGINGESRVGEILENVRIRYIQNYTLKNSKFDFDFVALIGSKIYVIEVKNRSYISKYDIQQICNNTSSYAAQLSDFIKDTHNQSIFIEKIVVMIKNNFPKTEDKSCNVLHITQLEEWIKDTENISISNEKKKLNYEIFNLITI